MKKGGFLIKTGVTFKDNLLRFINGSIITTLGGNTSASGIIFQADNVAVDVAHANVIVSPGKIPCITPATKLIIKICITSAVAGRIFDAAGDIIPGMPAKRPVRGQEFRDEVAMQSHVYMESMNAEFNPICPSILWAKEVRAGTASRVLDAIKARSPQINRISTKYDIGFIIMEIADGRSASDFFPNWGNPPVRNDYSGENYQDCTSIRNKIMINYAWALLRLRALGIFHGDNHLENAIVCSPYDFYATIKVFIIDFGLSRRLTLAETANPNFIPSRNDYFSYLAVNKFFTDLTTIGIQIRDSAGAISTCISIPNFITIMKSYQSSRTIKFFNYVYDNNLQPDINAILDINIPRIGNMYNEGYFVGVGAAAILSIVEAKKYIFDNVTPAIPSSITNGGAINIPAIAINQQSNCCANINPANNPDNNYYNYVRGGDSYNWAHAKALYDLDPKVIRVYEGRELPDAQDGVYLWIIGSAVDDILKLFCILCNSAELATKHAHLVAYANLNNWRLAGELIKNGQNITFNFSSGTYMHGRFVTLAYNPALIVSCLDKWHRSAKLFMHREMGQVQMNINYDPTSIVGGRLSPSYLDPVYMCDKVLDMVYLTQRIPGNPAGKKFIDIQVYPNDQAKCLRKSRVGLIGAGLPEENYDLSLSKYEKFTSQLSEYSNCISLSTEVLNYIKSNTSKVDKFLGSLMNLATLSRMIAKNVSYTLMYGENYNDTPLFIPASNKLINVQQSKWIVPTENGQPQFIVSTKPAQTQFIMPTKPVQTLNTYGPEPAFEKIWTPLEKNALTAGKTNKKARKLQRTRKTKKGGKQNSIPPFASPLLRGGKSSKNKSKSKK